MLVFDYHSSVSPYIKQVGKIESSFRFLGVEKEDVTCHAELYDPFNQGLAMRFRWRYPKFDRIKEKRMLYAISLLGGSDYPPIEHEEIDPKEQLRYDIWEELTNWGTYRDYGGPVIWVDKLSKEELNDLLFSLNPYLDNLQDLSDIFKEKDYKQSLLRKTIKEIGHIKDSLDKIKDIHLSRIALEKIIGYTKNNVLAKAIAGRSKDPEEIAEISLLIKQIKNYKEESAELISNYRSLCENYRMLTKEFRDTYWEVKHLPIYFERQSPT